MADDAHFGQTLGLIFEERTMGPLEQPPTVAQIYLQTYTSAPREGFEGHVRLLTPVNVTPEEFDYHADRLIENITRLKAEARRKFVKAHANEARRAHEYVEAKRNS